MSTAQPSSFLVLGSISLLTCPNLSVVECMSGLYLYLGRCESNCPPNTYPGINAKERPACMPCHYTCLTCAGESDAQCTSCHDEAVPTPSGSRDDDALKAYNNSAQLDIRDPKPGVRVEDLPTFHVDSPHLSWGRRQLYPLVSKSVLTKKAVTKKILEPYSAPRTLYFCYPKRMVEEAKASTWYRRLTVVFAVNSLLLLGVLLYLFFTRNTRPRPSNEVRYRYSKMTSNGDNLSVANSQSIVYISSSSEEG